MTPLKFRAWDSENKWMITQGEPDNEKLSSFAHHYLWSDENIESGKTVIMQSTGLKDKNGKEIFEGDILDIKDPEKLEVKWGNGGFYAATKRLTGFCKLLNAVELDCAEIIGNIYENPELL